MLTWIFHRTVTSGYLPSEPVQFCMYLNGTFLVSVLPHCLTQLHGRNQHLIRSAFPTSHLYISPGQDPETDWMDTGKNTREWALQFECTDEFILMFSAIV